MRFKSACFLASSLALAVAGCGGSSGSNTQPTAPTITWSAPASITYGTALSATQLNATASVPGTFAYSPASGAVLTAGQQTLSVTFTPTDTTKYTSATASVTLTVAKATPTVTWATPAGITYGTALSAAQLDATASVAGTLVYSPAAGQVPAIGSQTLSVTFTPTDATDYNTATTSVTLAVSKATPTITWATPAGISYGTALSATQLNATASVPGTLVYTPAAGQIPAAGSQTLSVTFTPTDTNNYNTATTSVTLAVSKATPTITWATPAGISYGTALSATQLNATASVPGTLTYTPAAGQAPAAGSQTLSVTFTPTDATDYNTATANVTLAVSKATTTITWATPAGISYGTALSATQLNATASVPGTLTYTPAAGQILTVGNQTLSVVFTPTDAIDYNSANSTVSLAVSKATPTLTWAAPAAITYGTTLSATQLNATAADGSGAVVPGTFVYSPALGTQLTVGSQSLSVSFTPADAADYNNASTSVMLTVGKATPTITWAAPAPVAQGSTLGSTQLNATATDGFGVTLPGSFVYTPASGTALNTPGTVSLSTTFTPTDAADFNTATKTVSLTVNPPGVIVDFSTQDQLIRGFGGSTAWLGQMTQGQANSLFSPATGLGLSILRVRIDPTGAAINNWVPKNNNWAQEATNGKEAVAANANAIVFATPWTPPATWKLNGTGSTINGTTYNEAYNASCGEGAGFCGGYLDPTHYADYATYLEDFVTYFDANAGGVNLYAISMQNEPDANTSYESCVWTPQQMDSWVAGYASKITSDSHSTKLMMPESQDFLPDLANTALNDPNAESLISIVGGHIYQVLFGGSIAPYSIPAGDSPKELWQTEFGPLSSTAPSWSQALTTYAESIHNSMVTGQYNAYVWWGILGDSTGSCATAAGTCGLVDQAGTVTVTGKVMGQYSKFIQPGYYRYNATEKPAANVYVSAYGGTSGGQQRYVIVAINAGSSALTNQPFAIQNATVTTMTATQSTASTSLVTSSPVSVTGDAFTYTLPAQSITTFVLQ